MALATRQIVVFPTEFGDIVVTLEYDNVALVATGVICVNPSPNNVKVVVTRESDGKQYPKVFGPGTTRLDFPPGQAGKIDLVFNSRGGLNGYAVGCAYPA